MIDFHNHILPAVDDGSKTMQESISMLRVASSQGIREVVQTVHFQHPKMDGKNVDYAYLLDKMKKLQSEIDKERLNIKLHLSAEVFYLPNLTEILNNPLVTIGNGKFMLIEFKSNIFPYGYEEEFYNLQLKGVTPIIAHPERYRFIQQDTNIAQAWIDRGYVLQIDAGSIIGQFGEHTKEISHQLLDSYFIHLIGSDAHDNKKRNFCLDEAYQIIKNKISDDFINYLQKNVKNILNGKDIENII